MCGSLVFSSLSNMAFTMLDIADATATKLTALNFLKDRHLLITDPNCQKCQTAMRLHAASASLVGFMWSCPNRACRARLSVLHGSMLQNAKLSLRVIVFLLYEWARDIPQDIVAESLGLSKNTVCSIFRSKLLPRSSCTAPIFHGRTFFIENSLPPRSE